MGNTTSLQETQFDIPIIRPHPGYWVCSVLFSISSFSIIVQFGIAHGIPLILLAIILPFVSYWTRSNHPQKIEVNKDHKSITQVFKRFGKTRKVVIDSQSFNVVQIQTCNSRFPKAVLMLSENGQTHKNLELARVGFGDTSLNPQEINIKPHVFVNIASTLEVSFGLTNLSD